MKYRSIGALATLIGVVSATLILPAAFMDFLLPLAVAGMDMSKVGFPVMVLFASPVLLLISAISALCARRRTSAAALYLSGVPLAASVFAYLWLLFVSR